MLIPIDQIFTADLLLRSDDVKIPFIQQHYYLANKQDVVIAYRYLYKQILFLFVHIKESPNLTASLSRFCVLSEIVAILVALKGKGC